MNQFEFVDQNIDVCLSVWSMDYGFSTIVYCLIRLIDMPITIEIYSVRIIIFSGKRPMDKIISLQFSLLYNIEGFV